MPELSFQYSPAWRRRGMAGRAASPAVSRHNTKAWWSEEVGMYLASLGRVSRRGGRRAVSRREAALPSGRWYENCTAAG